MLCDSDLRLTTVSKRLIFRNLVFKWLLKSGSALAVAASLLPLSAASALANPLLVSLLSSPTLVSDYRPGSSEPVPPEDDATTSTSGRSPDGGSLVDSNPSDDSNRSGSNADASESAEEETVGTSSHRSREEPSPELTNEARTPSQVQTR